MIETLLPSLPDGFDRTDVALALLAGTAGVIASFAVAGVTPAFVAAPISSVAATTLPSVVITTAILVLGSLGQKLNLLTAVIAAGGVLSLVASLGEYAARRVEVPALGPVLGGVGAGLFAGLLTGAPTASAATGVGVAVVSLGGTVAARGGPADGSGSPLAGVDRERRRLLGGLPGVVGVSAAAVAFARRRATTTTDPPEPDALAGGDDADSTDGVGDTDAGGVGDADAGGSGAMPTHTPTETVRTAAPGTAAGSDGSGSDAAGGTAGEAGTSPTPGGTVASTPEPTETPTATPESEITRLLNEAARKSFDVDGMEPLVSEKFYEVDINAVNPDVSVDDWSLSLTGEVETEKTFSYEELTEMSADNRFVTLRCVGERLNGKKMDTALWTGVPVDTLLEEVSPTGECDCVMLRATDDFFEEIPLDDIRGGLLAYGMNGELLPRRHGYPMRILVPGHWGEVNVKWVDEIEFLDSEESGYWEKRNWQGTGEVNTVAKLKLVDHLDDGRIRVGGHAYAGTEGIQTVEVSVDGGESWNEARLGPELPSEDAWRQWLHTYDAPDSEHDVVVRATDGNGELQPKESSNPFPSGATGWVSKTIKP